MKDTGSRMRFEMFMKIPPTPATRLTPLDLYSSGSSSPKGLERKYDSSNWKSKKRNEGQYKSWKREIGRVGSASKRGSQCAIEERRWTDPMQPDVTILSSRRERLPGRVHSDRVQGTAVDRER